MPSRTGNVNRFDVISGELQLSDINGTVVESGSVEVTDDCSTLLRLIVELSVGERPRCLCWSFGDKCGRLLGGKPPVGFGSVSAAGGGAAPAAAAAAAAELRGDGGIVNLLSSEAECGRHGREAADEVTQTEEDSAADGSDETDDSC